MRDIAVKIEKAVEIAKMNLPNPENNDANISNAEKNLRVGKTILFFDEANASDAIGIINEIMVDKSYFGNTIDLKQCGLEIIAACNPYRR